MSAPSRSLEEIFDLIQQYCAQKYPGDPPSEIRIKLVSGRKIEAPFPAPSSAAGPSAPRTAPAFVPNPFQEAILVALEGRALRTDALAGAVGGESARSRLFRHPGGLTELREQGLVAHHPRLGYYRPDAPPEELPGPE